MELGIMKAEFNFEKMLKEMKSRYLCTLKAIFVMGIIITTLATVIFYW